MLEIRKFPCNMLMENCYIVSDETKECVIIDCGAFYEEENNAIEDYIRGNKQTPRHLLLTHGHLDHNFGNRFIYDTFGLKPEVSAKDKYLMDKLKEQGNNLFHIDLEQDFPPVGHYFEEGESIKFGHTEFTIIETPGHSCGSVTFYSAKEQVAFTGDTLFSGSIGRTDFEGGSMFQIIQSLRLLAQLPDSTVVYPGHGPTTTIGNELAHNPYMDR